MRKYNYEKDKLCIIVDSLSSKKEIEEGLKRIDLIIKPSMGNKMTVIETHDKKEYNIKSIDEINPLMCDGVGDLPYALRRALELDSDITFVFTNQKKISMEKKDAPRCVLWMINDETIPIANFNDIGYIVKKSNEDVLD